MREGAPRGDINDGEPGGVSGLHAGPFRFYHLAVRFSTTVVLVHRGRQAEAAREKARRGVDAHDLLVWFGFGGDGSVVEVYTGYRSRSYRSHGVRFRGHTR